ncbi:hypothetical protein ABB02_01635 [Clostridiaceae bacterium JG1575]|nr:hypothetical protein ABB02_01635 [Clostridiaceae bacterium JG1575]
MNECKKNPQTAPPEPKANPQDPSVKELGLGGGSPADPLPTSMDPYKAELLQEDPEELLREETPAPPEESDPVPSPEDDFYDFEKDRYGEDVPAPLKKLSDLP